MINRRLDDYHRPLPHVIRLGSLADLAHQCNLCRDTNSVKKALLQNAATFITAKLRYTATDGTERTLEAGFTRYSVVFTGERLPDGTHRRCRLSPPQRALLGGPQSRPDPAAGLRLPESPPAGRPTLLRNPQL